MNSFYKHHGSSDVFIHYMVESYTLYPPNNIVKECIENGVIVETNQER